MGIDQRGLGQHALQRHEVEHPHALALDTDPAAFGELRESGTGGLEGAHVAVLVAPVEHLAREAERLERAHLEVGNDGDGHALGGDDDHKGPLHLVEVLAEDAEEIGAGNKGDGIEPGAGEDGVDGGEHVCCHGPKL